MIVTNELAYYSKFKITAVKKFCSSSHRIFPTDLIKNEFTEIFNKYGVNIKNWSRSFKTFFPFVNDFMVK